MNKKIHDKILKYLYDYGEYLYILQETFLCTLYETMATFPQLRMLLHFCCGKKIIPKKHAKIMLPQKKK